MLSLDDLWRPDQPLPDAQRLDAMAQRICDVWQMPDLARAVTIHYNARMRTALGRAFLRTGRIDLNPRLLAANPAELVHTLAHELAHLAAQARFGRVQAHGLHFRSFMIALGLRGRATHHCNVAAVKRRRGRYIYLHVCSDCGRKFLAASVRRNCYCRDCGPTMKWDIYRLPNTLAGRQMAAAAAQ